MAVRTGTLVIRVVQAKGLELPPGYVLPERIQRAIANDVVPSSVTAEGQKSANRISMHGLRKFKWWLPYCILTYDKNEILVEAVGGDLSNPTWTYKADFDVSRSSDVSISAYLRTAPGNARMGDDVLLGRVTCPAHQDASTLTDEWLGVLGADGKIRVQISYRDAPNVPLTIDSFELLKVIGKGSFGKVMQVRKKDTGRIYALKTIRKAYIVSRAEVTHTMAERTVLARVSNPFIVPLKFSFQSPDKLYLVLAFVNGGELFTHLQRERRFSEDRSRFYAAELFSALECLHSMDVVYRDLKTENVLIDCTGHIALCDFGLCKLNMVETERTNTFCGTPEYLAPEVIMERAYGKGIDWWTLGILLYEMLCGLPPFFDENHQAMYHRVLREPVTFPSYVRPEARSLLTGLLDKNPATRLGSGPRGAEEIKRHPFFSRYLDWDKLNAKAYRPPFKPHVESVADAGNFSSEFTRELAVDSVVEGAQLSDSVQQQFADFSFRPAGEYISESIR